jgi:voltage-gated potassium channel
MSLKRKICIPFFILIILLIIDINGYILIEKVSFLDSLYMTIITVTTVGFREVFPLTHTGKMFTIFVVLSGLGIFFYIAVTFAENALEGGLRKILGRRKMKILSKMNEHIIIAGFGRMGEYVSKELVKRTKKFILIEKDESRFAIAEELGFNVILGDATSENILRELNINKAKTLVSLLSSDADNMFTVLSAREMNPSIFIITRALDVVNEKKLYKMGADKVISPHEISSRRIINIVLKPNVSDFIDIMAYSQKLALSIEEITVRPDCFLVGKKIRDSRLREDYNTIVVAVKRDEQMFFNPSSQQVIQSDDILILLGEKEKLMNLRI